MKVLCSREVDLGITAANRTECVNHLCQESLVFLVGFHLVGIVLRQCLAIASAAADKCFHNSLLNQTQIIGICLVVCGICLADGFINISCNGKIIGDILILLARIVQKLSERCHHII